MSTLERRYRRILAFLPKAYRTDRAEEMLTALLDGARPGQTRPRPGDVFSLGALAVRLRFGAPGASARGQLAGDIARRVVLVSLMISTALNMSTFAVLAVDRDFGLLSITLAYELVQPALVLALLFGRRRVGLVLGAVYLLFTGIAVAVLLAVQVSDIYQPVSTIFTVTISALTALAVFPAFHREAPRLANRGRWLLLWVAAMAVLCSTSGALTLRLAPPEYLWPTTYVVVGLVATVFAIKQLKVSPVWPISLALGGCPVLADSFHGGSFLHQPVAYIALGFTGSIEVALIAVALASVAYHRRLVVARPDVT